METQGQLDRRRLATHWRRDESREYIDVKMGAQWPDPLINSGFLTLDPDYSSWGGTRGLWS